MDLFVHFCPPLDEVDALEGCPLFLRYVGIFVYGFDDCKLFQSTIQSVKLRL